MAIKIPTSFIATPSKITPNWDFWFENIPSGHTAYGHGTGIKLFVVKNLSDSVSYCKGDV
jgi:hypothetical protein